MSDTSNKLPGDVDTTGHSWDGIEEFNNPLPRWWLWCFYLCIIWGIGYVIAYPAWPLINQATPGLLGYSTRAEVAAEIAAVDEANAAITERLAGTELTMIAEDEALLGFARQSGAAVYRTWCAQCHGEGAAGVAASGYPNLLDDDWLWGGDISAIHETTSFGIRNETHDDARYSEMPAYGEFMSDEEIASVANYVMTLSGKAPADPGVVEAGAVVFADNCAACHMEDGTGDRWQGAPNLTDAIWLYGGDIATLTETITYARFGVMPGWQGRLSEAEIRAVASYVHGLGGGEASQ
ncbi:cytochrome-c oxidase, cbb3-type subunit III [Roseobacteraceae bacterium S113]